MESTRYWLTGACVWVYMQRCESAETRERRLALGVGSWRRRRRRTSLRPSEVDRNRHPERSTIDGYQPSGARH